MRWMFLGALWATVAAAQVTFVGSAMSANAATVTVPTGTQAGDLLLVAVADDNGQTGSLEWPRAFRVIHSAAVDSPDGQSWSVGYALATGSETSITVTSTGGNPLVAVAVYRGVDPLMPIAAEVEAHSFQLGGTVGPWTMTTPAMTLDDPNDLLVWVGGTDLRLGIAVPGYDGGALTPTMYTPPSGFTLRKEESSVYVSLGIADRVAGALSVGPFTAQAAVSYVDIANTANFMVALRPAASVQVVPGIEFIGQASLAFTNSALIKTPPGLRAGDLLLISVTYEDVAGTITWPTGFAEFSVIGNGMPAPLTTGFASGLATGSETSLTVSVGLQTAGLVTVLAYRGAELGPTSSDTTFVTMGPWMVAPPLVTAPPAGSWWLTAQVLSFSTRSMAVAQPAPGFSERHDESIDRLEVAFSDAPVTTPLGSVSVTDTAGASALPTYYAVMLQPRGGTDAGVVDAGAVDAGAVDAGGSDAGTDAGSMDAGVTDAGTPDAGAPDAGDVDAGVISDGGVAPLSLTVGCGCSSGEGWSMVLLAGLISARRRRAG